VVQDLGYQATFPLLLNVAGEPTYFIPLKDATSLVKMYAMVNVAQYQIVATGTTVSACERSYIQLLSDRGVTQPEDLPQTSVTGTVAEIRTAVLDGSSVYFLRLDGGDVFYAISAAQNRDVVTVNVGDTVTIDHETPIEGETGAILDGYSLTLGAPKPVDPEALPLSPLQESYDALPAQPVWSGTGLPMN